MGLAINDLRKRINVTLLEDRKRRWMSDSKNSLREFYKNDVIPMTDSLSTNLKELQQELIKEKNEMLRNELEKSSNDSKDIQANLLKRIKILENDFKRSQAQSIDFELKLQHQKEKMACDISWKSRLSTLNDENVLLKTQVDSIVQERENIKLEFQKIFNSIKATRTQHQKEVDELIEHVNQKTYAYADVRSQNQELLMTISELKNKIKTIENGKNVNIKFDKSETSGTLLCVTPFPINIAVKAKKVLNTKVNADRSKPVTSHSIQKNEKSVESSNSVRRPKSKDTKSKHRVLNNTNDKRPSAHVRKMSSSVSIDSNKHEIMNSTVCQQNASVLNTKTVNAVNDGSNIVCVSCVIQIVLWIIDSGRSKHMTGNLQLLRNFIEKFMGTVRFGNDHFAAITGYGDYVQGNLTISHVYYVEGLGHNLFLVGQFYDGDLKNRSVVHTRYKKTPYELIRGRKPNIQYFYMFGSLCYPTNDHDDLGKMKPKADIGIFIGYSESLQGFRIYNRQTKKKMETIHVKFDELTVMAFEYLDNLFGPLYEEYYATSSLEVLDNSAANTLDNEDTSSSLSIVVEEDKAPQIVSSSAV
ncbi:retrovirus-related pol polyprotein from transposon TNT 1-94 [Tanacetum coccineum]|uniref:Retrovirus-related pol polyprotein from transposon TNT 1-94 n=1 Tax=Tanacetum coccineum TaxID=301880 RepID=A0ABQ5HNU5_9ASTR